MLIGCFAPLAATLTDSVSFMVLLSPSATSLAEDRLFERSARLKAEGFTRSEIAEAREMQELYHQVVRTGKDFDRFEKAWHDNQNKRWFERVYLSDALLDPEHEYHDWFGLASYMPEYRNLSALYGLFALFALFAPFAVPKRGLGVLSPSRFENGEIRVVDLSGYLDGPIFEPFRDVSYFKRFTVNRDVDTVVWPNDADFSPDFLYEIGEVVSEPPHAADAAEVRG